MATPFEDLEFLAEYLPNEGETILLTRRGGELVCEEAPRRHSAADDGFADPEFYGRLVQANERLDGLGTLPIWGTAVACFWACVAMHKIGGLGWESWYLDLGLAMTALLGCFLWIRARQARFFRRDVSTMLDWQTRRLGMDQFRLFGLLRQHAEFRTLLDVVSRAGAK